ncbi:uncharacterized protein LOC112575490 isoform X1 [Pomacea canaliculata]|nr:uncharacterized protein LOC112575490 isoform X1 [Pomacea canaliculata]
MSWKCVIVGLVLVVPGTLLVAEGRFNKRRSQDSNDDGILALLKRFNKDQRMLERYSAGESVEPGDQYGEDDDYNNGLAPVGIAQKQTLERTTRSIPVREVKLPMSDNDDRKEPLALPVIATKASNQQQGVDSSGHVASSSIIFIMTVAASSVAAAIGIIMAGVCWYKYHKSKKAATSVEYPAYGVTGPTKDRLPSPGDRKLAQSAQMYHYQHQKQQMIAMEKANGDMKHDASDDESEEDNVEGDYTVYECPGLAPTGEMEVKNPLFRGEDTPSTPNNDDTQRPAGGN